MKAILFHGTDCNPDDFWYPWLAAKLNSENIPTEVPSYPTINHESIEAFIPKVMDSHEFDSETILIGHSAGAPLLLSILERLETPVKLAVLVAGYARQRPADDGTPDPVIQASYDWQKIKDNCESFIFINSTDDPWGCNDIEGRYMFDQLGGTLVIRNDGHFGSMSFNQPYKEFPLLHGLIRSSLLR